MSNASPPLLGFNNNVRHRGRIFHIQTEDSGVKFPRIVTHLFADGGRIVKTARTDYSEYIGKVDMSPVVRGMMKEQHKAMFASLRAGDLDQLLEDVCGPLDPVKTKPAPEALPDLTARGDHQTARVIVGATLLPVTENPVAARPLVSDLPAAVAACSPALAEAVDSQAVLENSSLRELENPRRKKAGISNPNLRRPTPSVAPPAADAFDLDVNSIDDNPPTSTRVPPPLVPRPARKSSPAQRKTRPPIPPRIVRPSAPTATEATVADLGQVNMGRPQARLATAPQTNARSIFGDGAISEQSLDEVILSYLAEDLDETK